MSDIDDFATSLLDESKRFLEKAVEAKDEVARKAFLHAALMLSFCSLEAHINSICDEFASRPEFSVHEKALLLEQDVKLELGEFKTVGLRMTRIEERILFLHLRVGGKHLDRTSQWWSQLSEAAKLRNRLTHPKEVPDITIESTRRSVEAIIASLDAIYKAIYKKPFPFTNLALTSQMNF